MSTKDNFWLRVGVEGAVIVLSILMAFGIDAWWDTQRALQLESQVLGMVAEEVDLNRVALARMIDDHDRQLARIDRFLRSGPDELLQVPNDSVPNWVQALHRALTYNPNQEAATLLVQTPVGSPEGLVLRAQVSRYLQALAEASEETAVVQEMVNNVMARSATHAVANANEGHDALQTLIARGGPAALAQLRLDNELVSIVIHKAMRQRVYRGELATLLIAMDSVATVLR